MRYLPPSQYVSIKSVPLRIFAFKRVVLLCLVTLLGACAPSTDEESSSTSVSSSAEEEKNMNSVVQNADPFLWLEEIEGEKALHWVSTQSDKTRTKMEAYPSYAADFVAARTILNSQARIPAVSLRAGYAYNFWQDSHHVRGVWRRMPTADYVAHHEEKAEWETLLDLDTLAKKENENWVFKGADCLAPNYTRCLISLSRGGKDARVLREYDLTEKQFLEDGFTLPEAKSSIAWVDKDTLLVGTDTGPSSLTPSGYPRTIRLWKRGQNIHDAPVIFTGDDTDMGVWPFADLSTKTPVAGVIRAITFFDVEFHVLQDDRKTFQRIPAPPKSQLEGFSAGQLILSLQEEWQMDEEAAGGNAFPSGAIVAIDPKTYETNLVSAPTKGQAYNDITVTPHAVHVSVLDNIVGRVLSVYASKDGAWRGVFRDLPEDGAVSVTTADHTTDDLLFYFEDPVTPETVFYTKGNNKPKIIKSNPAFFDAAGVVTRQYEAISKDGTKVPYFVTAKASVLEAGPAPTIQYGYGGFQISLLPTYRAVMGKLWIEAGGVWVTANIRGGGEFGPAWHQAAQNENRQRAYEDFFAVSESLLDKKITTKTQLGAAGRSNGGLLMGAALTQRPDLYTAIACGVPLLDMLRFHKLLAGASWIGEYGDPDDPKERSWLAAYSPYHHVQKDISYPKVYFYTSTKDDRVHPGHARKMAAKMEHYGHPFYYYENMEGGHAAGANKDQLARRDAMEFVYFKMTLGLR